MGKIATCSPKAYPVAYFKSIKGRYAKIKITSYHMLQSDGVIKNITFAVTQDGKPVCGYGIPRSSSSRCFSVGVEISISTAEEFDMARKSIINQLTNCLTK